MEIKNHARYQATKRLKNIVSALVVLIAASSCQDALEKEVLLLVEAKNRWLDTCDTQNYTAKFERTIFGWGGNNEFTVNVVNGASDPSNRGFKALFNLKLDSLRTEVEYLDIDIQYHPKNGYPVVFRFNDERMRGEDSELTTILVTGCGN